MLPVTHPTSLPWSSRALLIGAVVGYAAGLAAYVNSGLAVAGPVRIGQVIFFVLAAGLPVFINLWHGDRLTESGIRLDNLQASAREVGAAGVAMVVFIVAVGLLAGGFHWRSWNHFGDKALLYLVWGPVQQYLLNAFALRRLRQAGVPLAAAAVVAAGLFALVHAPNWGLVGLTAAGGLIWCGLFARNPNLLTLGLCHALAAVLLYYAWPIAWLHDLTIGRMYLARFPP